jgi:hypothetical protein
MSQGPYPYNALKGGVWTLRITIKAGQVKPFAKVLARGKDNSVFSGRDVLYIGRYTGKLLFAHAAFQDKQMRNFVFEYFS